MMKKKVGINSIILVNFFLIINCYTSTIKKIPQYNYEKIFENYYKIGSLSQIPIVAQASEEQDFSVTDDGYLVYSSNFDGNFDLYLRDLKTTIKLKIIEHPSIQKRPHLKKINNKDYLLVYESYDQNINGDIYIVSLKPKEIFELYINKREIYNYWNSSINLSKYIENYFESTNLNNCKGNYSEIYPMISDDGKNLFFLSNRCSNKFFLWKLPLKNGKPFQKPEIVIEKEIYYPSLSKNYIIFNFIENEQIQSKIGIWNLNTKELKTIIPKILNQPLQDGLIIKPKLSLDEKKLFAIYIPKDTNKNLILDEFDHNSLVSLDFDGNIISQITKFNQNTIYEYDTSSFLKNKIFYISDIFKEKDIFLTTYEGNIPKKNHPYDQYEFSKSIKNTEDYFFSLQKIFEYFFSHNDFPNIEGEIFYEILSYLKKSKNENQLNYYQEFFNLRRKENPLVEIFYKIKEMEIENKMNSKLIENYENFIKEFNDSQKDYFYFRLGELYWNNNPKISLKYFYKISKQFYLYGNVSKNIFLYYLINENNDINKFQESYLLDALQRNPNNIGILSKEIEIQLHKKNLNELEILHNQFKFDFLKYYTLYIKAEKLFLKNNFLDSLNVLNEIQKYIDNHFKEYLRILKLKTLKLKINILKKFNLERELLDTRNEFINTYRKELGIELDREEIQSIIEASNQFVLKYRKAAKDIYGNIKKYFFLLENVEKIKIKNLFSESKIEISLIDLDNLKEFCDSNSLAGKLIDDYNYPEYEIRYANLCKNLAPYLIKGQNKIPVELVFETNQLMYLASYAYANLINILFINVHQSEIFQDFHRQWSNYYHRLKVDLAVERFKDLIDWQEKKLSLLTKEELTNLLIEKDPFDGTIFNDLLYGYREIAGKLAQETLEFSVLYGHAYTLIRKSIEREKFYDSLFLKGFSISNNELIERKKKILLDLKEAENQLLYILSLEPTNEDASLLLSYLYSYLDYRREQNILNPPGYFDRFFRWITRRNPQKLTDGIFYRNLYSSTFPKRLYENNISLLENTLQMRKLLKLNISNEVYLSLALNYYKIFNYKKAIEYFELSEKGFIKFDDNLKKALFYYYYAKSNFYENNFSKAIELLDESYKILYQFYEKEKRAYNILFAKQKEINIDLKPSKELLDLKVQIASILILKSLCRYNLKEYNLANNELKQSLDYLKDTDIIKKYNIFNLLALNALKENNYQSAIYYANLALKEVENLGLSRNDERFLPQTVGGRFLGLFINFNEDFAVIGDSKIPDEIPSLRSYYISFGILSNVYKSQKDYLTTIKLLKQKKKTVEKQDLDVSLGKETYLSLLNQIGTINFYLKNYDESLENFYKAYQFSLKYNFLKDYYLNLKNIFYVLFSEIENYLIYSINDKKKLLNKINKINKEFFEFKKNFYDLRKSEYLQIKKTENPDYQFTEYDKKILTAETEKELREFYILEALLEYYQKVLNSNSNTNFDDITEKLKKILNSYKKDNTKDILYFKTYLNLFKIQLIQNKNHNFLKEWENLSLEVSEYDLSLETIELFQIKGDYYYLNNNCEEALKNYQIAFEKLESSLYFIENPLQFENLIKKYIDCLIFKKQYKTIIEIKEKFRFFILHNLFFSNPIETNDQILNKLYEELNSKIQELKNTKIRENQKRFFKKSVKKEKEEIQKLLLEINNYKRNLIEYFSNFKDYFFFDKNYLNQINPNIEYLYIFEINNQIHCLNIFKNQFQYVLLSTDPIEKCSYKSNEIVIIPDKSIYNSKIKEYIENLKNSYVVIRSTILDKTPVIIDKLEKLPYIENKNFFNIYSDFLTTEWNIKKQNFIPLSMLLAKEENSLGKYFLKKPTYSKVIINHEDNKNIEESFEILWILYDFYAHFGVPTIIDNNLIWGTIPIQKEIFDEYTKNLSKKYFQEGLKEYSKNPEVALEKFILSDSIKQDLKTSIYILATLIRISHPKASEYQNYLYNRIKSKQNFQKDLLTYYVMTIHSYSKIKNFEQAKETVLKLKKDFPNLKTNELENSISILLELERVAPNWKFIENLIDQNLYDSSFLDLITESLYQHSAYNTSLQLSKKYKTLEKIYLKNQLSLFLLDKNIILPDFKNVEEEDFENIFENKFEYIIDKIQNRVKRNITNILFYNTLKEKYQNHFFSLDNLLCYTENCEELNDFEEKFFFKFLIDSIPYDNHKVAKHNLIYLMDKFYKSSCLKGNIYLAKVIETYVLTTEYNTAFEFYQKYNEFYNCILESKEILPIIDQIATPLAILRAMDYKIKDPLILKLITINPNLEYLISLFIKILNEPISSLINIFKEIKWNQIPKEYHKNIYDIFLKRYLKEKDFINFQNFSFLRENQRKEYLNKIQLIEKNIKNNEKFINIIEMNSKFYICEVKTDCVESTLNVDYLRNSLNRFFYEAIYYEKQTVDLDELLNLYSKIYEFSENKITYFWLSGIHKYYPLIYKENCYFVLNPLEFQLERKEFYVYKNYSLKIDSINFDKEIQNHLLTILNFKNIFLDQNKNIYFTEKEQENSFLIVNLNKKKFSKPYFDKEEWGIKKELSKGSGILYFRINSPYILLKLIDQFFNYQNLSLGKKLNIVYKNFRILYPEEKDYLFIRPFTQYLIR